MKKLLAIAMLIAATMVMVSCSEDDEVVSFNQPIVTTGSIGDIANGGTGSVDFVITLDGTLTQEASWTLSFTGFEAASIGGATSGTIGASATVTADITAGTTAGAGSVTLTVTNPSEDSQGGSGNATAVGSVLEVGDESIAISMIPATATIDFGADLAGVPYAVDGLDGIVSFTVQVNGQGSPASMAGFVDPAVTLDGSETALSGTFTFDWATLLAVGGTAGNNAVVFTATDSDGDVDEFTHTLTVNAAPETEVELVRGNIEENTTWTADKIWQLDTRVTVIDGVTLTIEPGTVIKGNEGQGAASTALLVARGGKLIADGTAALPIIFTSVFDPIDPAEVASGIYTSTTSPTQAGLWGGVIVLGRAPISAQNDNKEDVTEVQIEGVPASDPNGLYGGTDAADNSGVIKYISIRHGGTNIGAGNEINGLTLGGIGSATVVENIEVVANADDGIEIFGGNVSVDKVMIWNSFDDSMDTDQDWVGTVENFIIVAPNTGSAFELDGPEGTQNRTPSSQFIEGVLYGGPDIDAIVDWDDNTDCGVSNVYFFGITAGALASFNGDGTGTTENWETDLTAAGTFFAGAEAILTLNVQVANKSYGPVAADFPWTWAGQSGALSDLGL